MCTDCIKNKQNPLLFSNVNCLNSGSVSANLPELSEIKKMLIAHVHVLILMIEISIVTTTEAVIVNYILILMREFFEV